MYRPKFCLLIFRPKGLIGDIGLQQGLVIALSNDFAVLSINNLIGLGTARQAMRYHDHCFILYQRMKCLH